MRLLHTNLIMSYIHCKLTKNGRCRFNTHCCPNALFYIIKCRPNAAIVQKPDHDLNNLPKNGLCGPNHLIYMIKCRPNAVIAHKPEHDLIKLSKNGLCRSNMHCRPNTHCRLNASFDMI